MKKLVITALLVNIFLFNAIQAQTIQSNRLSEKIDSLMALQQKPDEKLVIIVMLNNQSIGSRAMKNSIAGLLLTEKFTPMETEKPKVEITLDTEKAQPFEGTYRMEDGMVNQMIWHQSGRDFNANREIETEPLTQEQLALFAGDYYQPYLETDYPVLMEDDRLKVLMPSTIKRYLGFETVQLSHVRDDLFATDFLGMLEFKRDDHEQVNGFTLFSVGRLKDIVFLKK